MGGARNIILPPAPAVATQPQSALSPAQLRDQLPLPALHHFSSIYTQHTDQAPARRFSRRRAREHEGEEGRKEGRVPPSGFCVACPLFLLFDHRPHAQRNAPQRKKETQHKTTALLRPTRSVNDFTDSINSRSASTYRSILVGCVGSDHGREWRGVRKGTFRGRVPSRRRWLLPPVLWTRHRVVGVPQVCTLRVATVCQTRLEDSFGW